MLPFAAPRVTPAFWTLALYAGGEEVAEFQLSAEGWPTQLMEFLETKPLAKNERWLRGDLIYLEIAGPRVGLRVNLVTTIDVTPMPGL